MQQQLLYPLVFYLALLFIYYALPVPVSYARAYLQRRREDKERQRIEREYIAAHWKRLAEHPDDYSR
jgi:hypothetical protein